MWDPAAKRSKSGIAYHRAGRGSPVLLLHGIPGRAEAWAPTAKLLPDNVDVVIPDLLGFGASDRPSGLESLHATSQARALSLLVDELGLTSFAVVGHDFGGPVAITLSGMRAQDVIALGLLATNVFADTPIPFPLRLVTVPVVGALARRVLFSGPSQRMMLRQGTGPGVTPPDPGANLGDAQQQRAIATLFAGSLTNLDALYRPIQEQLIAIACPTYVGWGDQDPFFSVAQGARTAAAASAPLRVYRGAGHFLPHERPTEVCADIMDLLGRALSSTPAGAS